MALRVGAGVAGPAHRTAPVQPLTALGRRAGHEEAPVGTYGRRPARTGRVMLVDGIHDLGGMQGLGAVAHSPAEPAFEHRWQAVARALMAVGARAGRAHRGAVPR